MDDHSLVWMLLPGGSLVQAELEHLLDVNTTKCSKEEQHEPTLLAFGKLQEGKTIMRVAGLTRKGMSQNMPASYLRCV
eukprot:1140069-Pelagomonas_calceolata.AAC.1